MNEHEILTLGEVAELLRVHRSTIYRLVKKGKLPFFRIGPDYRFERYRINEWRAQQEINAQMGRMKEKEVA
jgi:excisionase family DNA binding protein